MARAHAGAAVALERVVRPEDDNLGRRGELEAGVDDEHAEGGGDADREREPDGRGAAVGERGEQRPKRVASDVRASAAVSLASGVLQRSGEAHRVEAAAERK